MSLRRTVSLILAVSLLSATAPVIAKPNTGAYQRSAEAFKQKMYDDCQGLKNDLDTAEKEADKRAGTKAAAKYAKLADGAWKLGNEAGCSWAA